MEIANGDTVAQGEENKGGRGTECTVIGWLVSFWRGGVCNQHSIWAVRSSNFLSERCCFAGLVVPRTLGSMQSSLQSRLVVQKTMIRLLPPAPYTLTMSLIVLDRLIW